MKNIPKKQFAGWMLMLLLCISISAFAQSPKKVTGRVMDAQGELLIGVNVTEAADPSNGVVTDINGTYTITLKGNKPSLKFSYIGFKDKVVAVGSKGVLDIALEEDVAALDEFEDKFKRHAVHVGHRQDTDDRISRLDLLTQYVLSKICIAPECTVWNHYSLGETGSSAGIVDHSQLIRILFHIVVDMVFAEVLRILDTEHLVEVFARISQLVGT